MRMFEHFCNGNFALHVLSLLCISQSLFLNHLPNTLQDEAFRGANKALKSYLQGVRLASVTVCTLEYLQGHRMLSSKNSCTQERTHTGFKA